MRGRYPVSPNFFRYAEGERPVVRLNSLRNELTSSYPVLKVTASTGSSVVSRRVRALPMRRYCRYPNGVSPVAFLNRRANVRSSRPALPASRGTVKGDVTQVPVGSGPAAVQKTGLRRQKHTGAHSTNDGSPPVAAPDPGNQGLI